MGRNMRNNTKNRLITSGATLVFAALLVWSPVINPASSFFDLDWSEEDFWSELNECTTGVCSGSATPDGKPLLWKNRDVGNSNQEFHYWDDGRIPFISITYRNQADGSYWGGVNTAGFAVENSNSYNLDHGGPPGGDDDGWIHREALATCRTVDDFDAYLDSLNENGGRTLNCNYGAFDAFGGAAMFETGHYSHTRIDCDEVQYGIIVRSNYSYSGNNLNNRSGYWGPHRHDRAYTKWKEGYDNDDLTPKHIFQQVIRDVSIEAVDPYPLPLEGYYGNYPYGHLPNGEAICRATTRGVLVVQGVQANENPDGSILWAMAGNQIGTLALPLWVRAGSVPVEFDGLNGSSICDMGKSISSWVNKKGSVDTWKLTNSEGTGIWDYTWPIEDWVFDKTEEFISSPDFDFDLVESFQNEIAEQVAAKLADWTPAHKVTEISNPIFVDNNIEFVWSEVTADPLGRNNVPQGYSVYRSNEPFREDNRGELIATVEGTSFQDQSPPVGAAFYRVEAIF